MYLRDILANGIIFMLQKKAWQTKNNGIVIKKIIKIIESQVCSLEEN